jgi:hypothetical protein
MIVVAIFLTVGVAGAAGFGYAAIRGFAPRPRSVADLQQRLNVVDVLAFLNLIDPAEDAFLQRELPKRAYIQVRRMRIRATLAYLAQARANARLLLAYAQHGMASPNPETAAIARALVTSAFRFELLALGAGSKLCAQWLFPTGDTVAGDVVEAYERLRFNLQRIVALDAPAASARVAAGL